MSRSSIPSLRHALPEAREPPLQPLALAPPLALELLDARHRQVALGERAGRGLLRGERLGLGLGLGLGLRLGLGSGLGSGSGSG